MTLSTSIRQKVREKMGISKAKKQIVIDNYFKNTCDVNTSIKEAFTKGFEIGLKKAPAPEPRWIPVSERLPEIHNYMQEYIVTIKGNFIRTAFFTENNGELWWSIDNVKAWMPLPKPYKAESEE